MTDEIKEMTFSDFVKDNPEITLDDIPRQPFDIHRAMRRSDPIKYALTLRNSQNGKHFQCSYSMGVGLVEKRQGKVWKDYSLQFLMYGRPTVWDVEKASQNCRWKLPDLETILTSLQLDSMSEHNRESFDDWCDNYGYDNDSINAEKIWRQCVDACRDLRDFMGREMFETFMECVEE